MKALIIAILVSIVLTMSFSVSAETPGQTTQDSQDGQMMGMMSDDHSRSMMMDQIAKDPEMRQEMISTMMQAMFDSEGMDPAKMMDDPEMMSMMKKHMMCAQAIDGGMMGGAIDGKWRRPCPLSSF